MRACTPFSSAPYVPSTTTESTTSSGGGGGPVVPPSGFMAPQAGIASFIAATRVPGKDRPVTALVNIRPTSMSQKLDFLRSLSSLNEALSNTAPGVRWRVCDRVFESVCLCDCVCIVCCCVHACVVVWLFVVVCVHPLLQTTAAVGFNFTLWRHVCALLVREPVMKGPGWEEAVTPMPASVRTDDEIGVLVSGLTHTDVAAAIDAIRSVPRARACVCVCLSHVVRPVPCVTSCCGAISLRCTVFVRVTVAVLSPAQQVLLWDGLEVRGVGCL